MRKILKFDMFNEAIIMPHADIDTKAFMAEVKDANIKFMDYSDINVIAYKYGFDIVDYKTFYNELPNDQAKSEAPSQGEMFFALLNPITKQPRLVINIGATVNTEHLLSISTLISNVLRHEFIHKKQLSLRDVEYSLPNPNDKQAYYSDKDEIMAFSYNIAQDLYDNTKDVEKTNLSKMTKEMSQHQLYKDISTSVSTVILNRYNKYIYQYLEKMISEQL